MHSTYHQINDDIFLDELLIWNLSNTMGMHFCGFSRWCDVFQIIVESTRTVPSIHRVKSTRQRRDLSIPNRRNDEAVYRRDRPSGSLKPACFIVYLVFRDAQERIIFVCDVLGVAGVITLGVIQRSRNKLTVRERSVKLFFSKLFLWFITLVLLYKESTFISFPLCFYSWHLGCTVEGRVGLVCELLQKI